MSAENNFGFDADADFDYVVHVDDEGRMTTFVGAFVKTVNHEHTFVVSDDHELHPLYVLVQDADMLGADEAPADAVRGWQA